MLSERLSDELSGYIEKWTNGTFLTEHCFDDGNAYKRAPGPLVFPFSSITYIKDSPLEFSLHGSPIGFAIKKKDERTMHIALVNVRTTPTSQPFILPPQSECRSLNSLMSMVFSGLRSSFMRLSDNQRFGGHFACSPNLHLIVSVGYMQISTSLTSKEFVPADTAQGITIDYVADTALAEGDIAEAIKSMNQEYCNIATYLMKHGKI